MHQSIYMEYVILIAKIQLLLLYHFNTCFRRRNLNPQFLEGKHFYPQYFCRKLARPNKTNLDTVDWCTNVTKSEERKHAIKKSKGNAST